MSYSISDDQSPCTIGLYPYKYVLNFISKKIKELYTDLQFICNISVFSLFFFKYQEICFLHLENQIISKH